MQADQMLPREDLLRSTFFNEELREQGMVMVIFSREEYRDFFFSIVSTDVDEDRLYRASASSPCS